MILVYLNLKKFKVNEMFHANDTHKDVILSLSKDGAEL